MDLSGLERLGKVAGISGISVGAVVLLLNGLIGTIPGLPADQQAGIVRLLAILSFGIGAVGNPRLVREWAICKPKGLHSRHSITRHNRRG